MTDNLQAKYIAKLMNGKQYSYEEDETLFDIAKQQGLVIVYGASDDLMQFRGAIDDEVDCIDGGTAYVNADGLVKNECAEGYDCPNAKGLFKGSKSIEAVWADNQVIWLPSWSYKTEIPHGTFEIFEDDDLYCRGIVFALADCK